MYINREIIQVFEHVEELTPKDMIICHDNLAWASLLMSSLELISEGVFIHRASSLELLLGLSNTISNLELRKSNLSIIANLCFYVEIISNITIAPRSHGRAASLGCDLVCMCTRHRAQARYGCMSMDPRGSLQILWLRHVFEVMKDDYLTQCNDSEWRYAPDLNRHDWGKISVAEFYVPQPLISK